MKSVSGANLAKPEQEPSGEAGSWRAEGWWAWSCDGRCFCIGIQKTWCLNLEHVFWLRHTCTHNIRRTRSGWRSSTNHRCYWLRVITCTRLVNGRQQSCSSAVLRVSSRNINLFSGDLDVSRMNLLRKTLNICGPGCLECVGLGCACCSCCMFPCVIAALQDAGLYMKTYPVKSGFFNTWWLSTVQRSVMFYDCI